jgi:multicomponent Na+:H+ antiporter subunit G
LSPRELAVLVLLALGVGVTLLSCVGVVAIAAAVVLEERLSAAGIKAVLVALVLVVTNPVLGHATARAARIRQFGQWTVREEERQGGDRP